MYLSCCVVLQVVLSCLCNPPKPGDASYDLFQQERSAEFASLARRAALVSDAFNSLPNMSVVPTKAAMYSFPQVGMGSCTASSAAIHSRCNLCLALPVLQLSVSLGGLLQQNLPLFLPAPIGHIFAAGCWQLYKVC